MKLALQYIFVFLLVVFSFNVYCQNANLDSLLSSLEKKADPVKTANTLKKICYEYGSSNPDSAVYFGKKAVEASKSQNDSTLQVNCIMALATAFNAQGNYKEAFQTFQTALDQCLKLQYNKGIAYCYGEIGNTYKNTGDNLKALEFYSKDLDFEKKIKDNLGIADAYGNIGNIYEILGNYPTALDNQLKALKISQSISENQTIGNTYTNIGTIYTKMNDYDKALEYQEKALSLNRSQKDEYNEAQTLLNIGVTYQKKHNYSSALNYNQKSLDIEKRLNDLAGMAISYGNIGELYELMGKYSESLLYQEKALQLQEKLGDKTGIANSSLNFANCYYNQNEINKALIYSNKALLMAQEIHGLDLIKQAYELLNKCYDKIGNKELAYLNFKNFIAARDRLLSNEKTKEVTQKEMEFNFKNQQTLEKAEQEKKDIAQKAQSKQQRFIIFAVIGGLLLVIIFSFFLYKRFRITNGQKIEIEQQKYIVDKKQKEILDSITYAKRIQTALLTSEEYIKNNLPAEHFILFKPKDIVSGDFYWAHKTAHRPLGDGHGQKIQSDAVSNDSIVTTHNDDLARASLFYIATGDCTGHGVPGAFMSMLNISCLNQNVIERGIRLPHEILNAQRIEIIKALNPPGSAEVSRDGMDCVLCAFDFGQSITNADSPLDPGLSAEGAVKLHFAAANNPLWLVRNGELQEYKADKMPVGKYTEEMRPFALQTIELQKGDIIYTSTDGFADQFGTNGKKLMKKKFKEELLKIQQQPMSMQKEYLNQFFENWKGNLEQVDDVCIIGVRI